MTMNVLRLIVIVSTIFICACTSTKAPPTTAGTVDLPRYMGKWYEVASFPNRFQSGCRCTTAQYKLTDDSTVAVLNECVKGKGDSKKLTQARGKAWVVDHGDNSKLKVQFFWPFRGDYWILDVAPSYQYALVGTPDRKYLWVLARIPYMNQSTYHQLVVIAKQKGYDVKKLRRTTQNCFFIH